MEQLNTLNPIIQLAIFAPLILISVVLHEVSHGKAAELLGDPTAKNMGRLTLNPLKHLDLFGSFILPLIMFVIAGIGLGYAKPVPIDPRHFKSPQKGMAITSIAGPLVNFVLAAFAGLFIKLGIVSSSSLLGGIIILFVLLNVLLGVFNAMPIPPLDGSKVVAAFLPKSSLYTYYRMERYGMIILLVLLIFFPQVLRFVFVNIIEPLARFLI